MAQQPGVGLAESTISSAQKVELQSLNSDAYECVDEISQELEQRLAHGNDINRFWFLLLPFLNFTFVFVFAPSRYPFVLLF